MRKKQGALSGRRQHLAGTRDEGESLSTPYDITWGRLAEQIVSRHFVEGGAIKDIKDGLFLDHFFLPLFAHSPG